jgi:SPFH domain / Band 7 family
MLDDAFASKDDIASSVLSQLQHVMKDYGYEINNTLVTDLQPDARVKASMNEINAARRLKEAASHKAEADKTRQVKGAEAEAEARYLSGLGVARQRKAIVEVSRALCTFMLVCVLRCFIVFIRTVSVSSPSNPSCLSFATKGLQSSVSEFSAEVHGATPKDVMDVLLLSQYFDTLSSVKANHLFLEHDPATVAALQRSVGMSFLKTGELSK